MLHIAGEEGDVSSLSFRHFVYQAYDHVDDAVAWTISSNIPYVPPEMISVAVVPGTPILR